MEANRAISPSDTYESTNGYLVELSTTSATAYGNWTPVSCVITDNETGESTPYSCAELGYAQVITVEEDPAFAEKHASVSNVSLSSHGPLHAGESLWVSYDMSIPAPAGTTQRKWKRVSIDFGIYWSNFIHQRHIPTIFISSKIRIRCS